RISHESGPIRNGGGVPPGWLPRSPRPPGRRGVGSPLRSLGSPASCMRRDVPGELLSVMPLTRQASVLDALVLATLLERVGDLLGKDARDQELVLRFVHDFDAVASLRFRAVERLIRKLQCAGRSAPDLWRHHGDAYADREHGTGACAAMLDGKPLDGFAHLLRGVRRAGAVRVIQDGRELL